MADHSAARGNTGTSGDHKGLIYAITGGILVVGLLLMAFYDRAGDPGPTASLQKPVVTAQK